MNMKDMENNNEPKTNLKNSVFERISNEKVSPRSRWVFRSREALVWSLWGSSVLIGAFAVTVTLFVLTYRQYALYEATHENFYTFIIEVLPCVWFVIFAAMAFTAVYNLRHTKHGYRYPVWQILASSIVLSFAGGAVLHITGFGYTIDHELGEHVSSYKSQDKIELRMWQSPENGRLVGHMVEQTVSGEKIIFEDSIGDRWVFASTELALRDIDLLQSERVVRILGKTTNFELRLFHPCGVFPVDDIDSMKPEKLGNERQNFIASAREHLQRLEEKMEQKESGEYDDGVRGDYKADSVCASLDAVRRVGNQKP